MSNLKHIGRIKSTGKKCIVAYRTIPGDAYSCLIIPTESLPDEYHDALINLVESPSGQSSYEFAESLARTNFSDGSIMLSALHARGKLIKVGTDKIEMLPRPAYSIALSELNQIIADQRGISLDELALKSGDKKPETTQPVDDPSKTTSASVNVEPAVESPVEQLTPEQQAKKYRSEADRLAKEAANFRRMAEELVPIVKKPRKQKTAV